MKSRILLDHLSDDEVLRRTGELAAQGKQIDAVLIAHMAEIDGRRLYRGQACPSMFAYATERLRLSEGQAYERITVARRSREYPELLEMLADGRLTLTAAAKLGPHLTPENSAALLERATRATRRQIEVLVAEVSPKADVVSSVRKLRARATQREVRSAGAGAAVVPIAPGRYRVQFTASAELEAKIARARALLRHTIPSGDVAAIVDQAMTVLLDKLERRRCGKAERPPDAVPTGATSRHVPAAVKRAVWQREDSRCTSSTGRAGAASRARRSRSTTSFPSGREA